jgi:6-phosphogluconolactonase
LPEQFDVLILGIGEDCHTASLFPGSPALHESERRVVPVSGPKPPFERLTLTPPQLRGGLVLVLAAGASKADAVHSALEAELDLDRYPAQLARDAVWIVDHAAASKLTGAWPSLH